MRTATKASFASIAGCGSYFGAFYVLMVPNLPAYDAENNPVFHNCPRFSEAAVRTGPLTMSAGRANFLNYFFYPFEFIYSGQPKSLRPNPPNGANRSDPSQSGGLMNCLSPMAFCAPLAHLDRSAALSHTSCLSG